MNDSTNDSINDSMQMFNPEKLANPDLFRQQAYIDGQWLDADNHATLKVVNPATGEYLGAVPDMGVTETQRAIAAANRAWPAWRSKTAEERARILHDWYELILQYKDDLALLMTLEQGKPLAEAIGEINYGASFVEWFSEEAKRIYGDTIPAPSNDKRIIVLRQSIGVVAAITPWNFPNAMITRKCSPALAAGCPVVIKPAEETPYSALALAVLGETAGIPPGILNIVTGDAVNIGGELTANPLVRKLSFTGSTEVGKLLMRQCADTVKKISLELGGNAAFIVFDDADIDAAVEGAIASKFRNSGQTCVCANRLLIQDNIYDEFTEKLIAATKKLQVGNGLDKGIEQGPLINHAALKKVEEHIQDATVKGAKVILGGKQHELGGHYFQPTILSGANEEMLIAQEETFGPVAALFRFKKEQQAIALANNTHSGLAAYFYARDIGRVWRVAEALEVGIVGINSGIISTAFAPFGGVKESGIGREGSKYGIEEFTEIKYVCMGGLSS